MEVEAADSRPVGSVEEKLFGHAFRCLKVLIILGGVEGTMEVALHSEVERGMRVRVEGVGLCTAGKKELHALDLARVL